MKLVTITDNQKLVAENLELFHNYIPRIYPFSVQQVCVPIVHIFFYSIIKNNIKQKYLYNMVKLSIFIMHIKH